jgi:L-rhamnose mutarotase
MMRSAWVMQLKPGQEAEYKRKHDEIWPEMIEMIKAQGISNYSIYRHGLLLFAHLERDESFPADAGSPELAQRWQDWMGPHLETNADGSIRAQSVEEVFRLD